MPEMDTNMIALLLAAGLLLLFFAVFLLLVLLRRQKQLISEQEQKQSTLHDETERLREQLYALPSRQEQNSGLYNLSEHISACVNEQGNDTAQRLDNAEIALTARIQAVGSRLDAMANAQNARIDALGGRMDAFGALQESRLNQVTHTLDEKLNQSENRIENMRQTVESGMQALRRENGEKLEEMRQTVDEKLHATLDKRLNESFSLVSERLEQVYLGLGEMKNLAGGVGDLKKVLTNVKTRGIWGEMQLGNILSQMLSPGQYAENIEVVPDSGQRVEFAVVMPGKAEQKVYLPIDSKFPMEDYERLLSCAEQGDQEKLRICQRALEDAFRTEAKRISTKYILTPYTTDFAVMFVPVEGLYAEALQRRGLAEEIQQKYRVVIAGPTTLSALLTSLQVGFRTMAIEKRSSEVWQLLGAVKGEFGKFTDLLEATKKRMNTVSESIENAARKSRTIERKLRAVEALEGETAQTLLQDGMPSLLPDTDE